MNKICVLYGGNSSERSVSLKSGKYIYESLIKNGYEASLIDFKHLIDLGELKYFDLVFIALHGEEGESGILQSKLERSQTLRNLKTWAQLLFMRYFATIDFFFLDKSIGTSYCN